MPTQPDSVPDFDDLPKVQDMPQGCAWGVFDKNGEKDLLGTLNFLTPEVVRAAATEVKDGVSFSLNWPMNALNRLPSLFRKPAKRNLIYLPDLFGLDVKSWDDELEFNTQASSQWDSLSHYQHQTSGLAYNGFSLDKQGLSVESTAKNKLPTLDHWHTRGCIAARGILLDFKAYAEEKKMPFGPFEGHRITVDDLEACAMHFGVEFRPGDVLLVRTGTTELIDKAIEDGDQTLLAKATAGTSLSGVHGCEDTARWLWNKRFAAAASDSNGFEAYPPVKADGSLGGPSDLVLHPYMLSCFGMCIGELWDLSRLSAYCKETKRYSFMLTSAPLNYPALIGSPPNALAIF
ncbi:hypothetical protein G6O67_004904 [Ophiocordyceps sinensis]|uniref:Cyclase n=1 Tax=Ophiocordyceps sinensis TaxID=72228 RepID=A0A8H4PQH5_9HYPO|nr:hypothetical protein G6O67_004904 [Ophiocordyceps sinensis]